jgi:hypothetical protein
MKRLLSLSLAALMLILSACQNEGPINGPESPASQNQAKFQPHWIGLPQNASHQLLKTFSTSQLVTVANGGQLTINETYTSTAGTQVHTFSSIALAPGCVQQDVTISMDIDDVTGVSTFMPHQIFNFPAILNQTFTGLNLAGKDVSKIHLYYYGVDGTWEIMQCDQLIVDVATGTITIVNGRLPHFSVYGYGD